MPTKKTIKVRDLKPNKDAKGGGSAINRAGANHAGTNSTSSNSTGANSHRAANAHGLR